MTLLRERYRVDLVELQTTCETNYVRLLRLLPNMRDSVQVRQVATSHGEQLQGVLTLAVSEACPYTTTLQVSQQYRMPWLPALHMEVRVYHDARMAEVIGAQNARRFRGVYPYPNADMHHPDEKTQLNLFLAEWLSHALACGHELAPLG